MNSYKKELKTLKGFYKGNIRSASKSLKRIYKDKVKLRYGVSDAQYEYAENLQLETIETNNEALKRLKKIKKAVKKLARNERDEAFFNLLNEEK